jgi:hypothetical protein
VQSLPIKSRKYKILNFGQIYHSGHNWNQLTRLAKAPTVYVSKFLLSSRITIIASSANECLFCLKFVKQTIGSAMGDMKITIKESKPVPLDCCPPLLDSSPPPDLAMAREPRWRRRRAEALGGKLGQQGGGCSKSLGVSIWKEMKTHMEIIFQIKK